LKAKIESLNAGYESEESEAVRLIETEQDMIKRLEQDKMEMAVSRSSDPENNNNTTLKK